MNKPFEFVDPVSSTTVQYISQLDKDDYIGRKSNMVQGVKAKRMHLDYIAML